MDRIRAGEKIYLYIERKTGSKRWGERDMKIERQTERWKERDVERYTDRLRYGEKGMFRHREFERWREREMKRLAFWRKEKYRNTETDRLRDEKIEI